MIDNKGKIAKIAQGVDLVSLAGKRTVKLDLADANLVERCVVWHARKGRMVIVSETVVRRRVTEAPTLGVSRQAGHIDGILDFQARPNVSVELPLVRGFNDVFWFDFRDLTVRDAYLADPVHQAIGGRIVAALDGGPDGVFVFDVAA